MFAFSILLIVCFFNLCFLTEDSCKQSFGSKLSIYMKTITSIRTKFSFLCPVSNLNHNEEISVRLIRDDYVNVCFFNKLSIVNNSNYQCKDKRFAISFMINHQNLINYVQFTINYGASTNDHVYTFDMNTHNKYWSKICTFELFLDPNIINYGGNEQILLVCPNNEYQNDYLLMKNPSWFYHEELICNPFQKNLHDNSICCYNDPNSKILHLDLQKLPLLKNSRKLHIFSMDDSNTNNSKSTMFDRCKFQLKKDKSKFNDNLNVLYTTSGIGGFLMIISIICGFFLKKHLSWLRDADKTINKLSKKVNLVSSAIRPLYDCDNFKNSHSDYSLSYSNNYSSFSTKSIKYQKI